MHRLNFDYLSITYRLTIDQNVHRQISIHDQTVRQIYPSTVLILDHKTTSFFLSKTPKTPKFVPLSVAKDNKTGVKFRIFREFPGYET